MSSAQLLLETPASGTPGSGLTAAEVAARVAAGRTNAVELRTSRPLGEIVRSNVLTFFNGLLLTLFVLTVATGRWQNGLFGLVIVANATIGISQEIRAKRVLDRLAVLNAPHARVVRDGATREIEVAGVVADDLVEVRAGDQIPADGVVVDSDGLEIDESLLTGEGVPVAKHPADDVRSGSIVTAGQGTFHATAVGADAYATQLAAEARRFTVARSELVAGTNRILRWISLLMLVVGPVLLWSQFRSSDNHGWADTVTGTVAGLVGLVPEGLVLLTSLAFMLATITLARSQTLIQELPAVEILARVDVVCVDKTGTLTDGEVVFDHLQVLTDGSAADVDRALALLSKGAANATAAAVAAAFPSGDWHREDGVPFNSTRKWSAAAISDHGVWVLGAPEMMLATSAAGAQERARAAADRLADTGQRVLLLAFSTTSGRLRTTAGPAGAEPELPAGLVPAALVVPAERVREDAASTVRFFTEQGVAVKVISGDNPRTVAAVAAAVGVPGADSPVDARTLPDDPGELTAVVERSSVFGRVTPQQKRLLVAALQRGGHVVAMTGDGVNDVLAIKDADIGIAMGNGSPATRAVAQIVLLDGKFARLPEVVAEGRRVIANIERSANLFLVKNAYSLVLAVIAAATLGAYPLAPIQLTLISTLTIGLPAFALALAPGRRRYVSGFVRRVLRFAAPVGMVTGASAYLGYRATRWLDPAAGVDGGRTTATVVVLIVSLATVVVLSRPLTRWTAGLVVALAAAVAVVVSVPVVGHGLFLLSATPTNVGVAVVFGAGGAMLVAIVHRLVAAGAGLSDGAAAGGPRGR